MPALLFLYTAPAFGGLSMSLPYFGRGFFLGKNCTAYRIRQFAYFASGAVNGASCCAGLLVFVLTDNPDCFRLGHVALFDLLLAEKRCGG